MKKLVLSILTAVALIIPSKAQLFKAADIEKIADYVVKELQLTGADAANVKSTYAEYGEKMRNITNSMAGPNVKAKQIQDATAEMDNVVKSKLPKAKHADYDKVTAHYRSRGITTSALGVSADQPAANAASGADLGDAKQVADALKQEFKNQLGVNDAQADKLVAYTVEHNAKKKVINQTYKADPKTKAEKLKELNLTTNAKVKELLNDQQYKTFLGILLKQGAQ